MKNVMRIEELKAIRVLRGIPIAKLAKAIGISPARLTRFESKEYRVRDHIMITNAYERYLDGKQQAEEIIRCHAKIRMLEENLQGETEWRIDLQGQVEYQEHFVVELMNQIPLRPRIRQVV